MSKEYRLDPPGSFWIFPNIEDEVAEIESEEPVEESED